MGRTLKVVFAGLAGEPQDTQPGASTYPLVISVDNEKSNVAMITVK